MDKLSDYLSLNSELCEWIQCQQNSLQTSQSNFNYWLPISESKVLDFGLSGMAEGMQLLRRFEALEDVDALAEVATGSINFRVGFKGWKAFSAFSAVYTIARQMALVRSEAAESLHIQEEQIGRFTRPRPEEIQAIDWIHLFKESPFWWPMRSIGRDTEIKGVSVLELERLADAELRAWWQSKAISVDSLLKNTKAIQAIHQRQGDRENEQRESLLIFNEARNEWMALKFWFKGWAKRSILGDALPGYLSDAQCAEKIDKLLTVTKNESGPDCIAKVAAFDASPYRTDEEDQQRYFHAFAVQWVIRLLNAVDESGNALAAVEHAKKYLEGYSGFELEVIATRLEMAAKVIRMGVVDRFCKRCGKRLSVNCFDVTVCCTPVESELTNLAIEEPETIATDKPASIVITSKGEAEKPAAKSRKLSSSKKTGTFEKWRAALLEHHKYDSAQINQQPYSPSTIQGDGVCSKSMASRHFERWGDYSGYERICDDYIRLKTELQFLAGEVSVEGIHNLVFDLQDKKAINPKDAIND